MHHHEYRCWREAAAEHGSPGQRADDLEAGMSGGGGRLIGRGIHMLIADWHSPTAETNSTVKQLSSK